MQPGKLQTALHGCHDEPCLIPRGRWRVEITAGLPGFERCREPLELIVTQALGLGAGRGGETRVLNGRNPERADPLFVEMTGLELEKPIHAGGGIEFRGGHPVAPRRKIRPIRPEQRCDQIGLAGEVIVDRTPLHFEGVGELPETEPVIAALLQPVSGEPQDAAAHFAPRA